MSRRLGVVHRHRGVADEAAFDPAGLVSHVRELLERDRQPVCSQVYCGEAASERTCESNALTQGLTHLPHPFLKFLPIICERTRRQIRLQEEAFHLQRGQLLAEPVVQILPNAPLFAVGDCKQLSFKAPPLRDIPQDPTGC